jgi:hypothetical protein
VGLTPQESACGKENGQPDAAGDGDYAGNINGSTDRFDHLVETHTSTWRALATVDTVALAILVAGCSDIMAACYPVHEYK